MFAIYRTIGARKAVKTKE